MAADAAPDASRLSKYWTITAFYDIEKIILCLQIGYKDGEVTGYCYQMEKCPDTDKVHLQGYVEFSTRKRLNTVKNFLMSQKVHVDIARGTADENIKYCTKEDTRTDGPSECEGVFVNGGKRGARTDLTWLREHYKNGGTHWEAMNDPKMGDAAIRYARYMDVYMMYKPPNQDPDREPINVVVLWGEAGTGKTRWAIENFKPLKRVTEITQDGKIWCDGYDYQPHLLIDEYRGEIPISRFLQLTDPYMFDIAVPIKGGFIRIDGCIKNIIITSNVSPGHWYPNIDEATWNGIKRRMVCYHVTKEGRELNAGLDPKEIKELGLDW